MDGVKTCGASDRLPVSMQEQDSQQKQQEERNWKEMHDGIDDEKPEDNSVKEAESPKVIPLKFHKYEMDYEKYLTMLHWAYRTKVEFDSYHNRARLFIIGITQDGDMQGVHTDSQFLDEMLKELDKVLAETSSIYITLCRNLASTWGKLLQYICSFSHHLCTGESPLSDLMVDIAKKQKECRKVMQTEFDNAQESYKHKTKQVQGMMDARAQQEQNALFQIELDLILQEQQQKENVDQESKDEIK